MIDTSGLTLKEKGYLVEKLTKEIVEEMLADDFSNHSDRNEKLSGLLRTFGEEVFIRHSMLVHHYTEEADV